MISSLGYTGDGLHEGGNLFPHFARPGLFLSVTTRSPSYFSQCAGRHFLAACCLFLLAC